MVVGLIERHIGATILRAGLMAAAALLVLVEFQLLIDEFGDVGRGTFDTWDAIALALLRTPGFTHEILPVAALIGSLLGLGGMAAHGEITALRSVGFSIRALVVAVLKTGVVLVVLGILFSDLIAPFTERIVSELRAEKQEDRALLRSEFGFWARDGRAFINIRHVEAGRGLGDIHIYEFDPQRRLRLATHAQSARPDGEGWQLLDIRQTAFTEQRLIGRLIPEARWDRLVDPEVLDLVVLDPEMLSTVDLYQYIRFMRGSGQPAIAYEVEFWGKFATPVAILVMMFLAVPFVLTNLRSSTVGQRTFLGVLLGAGFYLVSRGFSYAAIVYEISPPLMAFLPPLLFFALGFYLLRRPV